MTLRGSPSDCGTVRLPGCTPRYALEVVALAGVVDTERQVEEEKARIEARYRKVLKSSVEFEKRIWNRWREKNRRIAGLEARVAELERKLESAKDQR